MTCVLVLGTHRSGTSAVAGVLHNLGINMGDRLLGAHPSNPKGHFEDLDFLNLNDKVVKNWRNPLLTVTGEQLDRYQELVDAKDHQRLWGIKDPRLCITAKHFIQMLGDVKIVLVDRNTEASINSLLVVHGELNYDRAKTIQEIYLRERQDFLDSVSLPTYRVQYERLVHFPLIEIVWLFNFVYPENPVNSALDFIDPSLRHYG